MYRLCTDSRSKLDASESNISLNYFALMESSMSKRDFKENRVSQPLETTPVSQPPETTPESHNHSLTTPEIHNPQSLTTPEIHNSSSTTQRLTTPVSTPESHNPRDSTPEFHNPWISQPPESLNPRDSQPQSLTTSRVSTPETYNPSHNPRDSQPLSLTIRCAPTLPFISCSSFPASSISIRSLSLFTIFIFWFLVSSSYSSVRFSYLTLIFLLPVSSFVWY